MPDWDTPWEVVIVEDSETIVDNFGLLIATIHGPSKAVRYAYALQIVDAVNMQGDGQ